MSEEKMTRQDQMTIWAYLRAMYEDTYGTLKWCWDEFVNEKAKRFIKTVLIFGLLSRVVSLIYPWLMGLGIDGVIAKDDRVWQMAIVGTALTYVIGALLEWRQGRGIELTLGENLRRLDRRINELFFSKELGLHLQEGSLLTQSNMEKGYNRFHGVQCSILFGGIDSFLTLVITWVMLMVISPVAGGVVFVFLVVNLFISLFLNRFVMVAMEPVEALFRKINRRRNERWEGVERVVTSGCTSREVEEMDADFDHALVGDRRIWLRYIRGAPIRSILAGLAVTACFAYALYEASMGRMSFAKVAAILTWSGMASQQMRFLARVEREINWAVPSLKSLREALMLPTEVNDVPDAVELQNAPVRVEFSAVSHTYERANGSDGKPPRQVLRDLSFTIEPGETVALIGPSGGGKSTVTKLLQRYTDPTSGEIRVCGHDLRLVKQDSWRRLVAYIPQKAQVFDGTLRDNLLYGLSNEQRVGVTDEKIWSFMKRLGVDFGGRLSDGLDTRVGRHGMKLSGGEAQRVMIVAAALRSPQLMIIDEATSSLDAENQAAVQQGLHRVLEGEASALIIAHRLSTILACDKFVVLRPVDGLKDGDCQVEAVAYSPQELYQTSPTFRRLADLEGVKIAI